MLRLDVAAVDEEVQAGDELSAAGEAAPAQSFKAVAGVTGDHPGGIAAPEEVHQQDERLRLLERLTPGDGQVRRPGRSEPSGDVRHVRLCAGETVPRVRGGAPRAGEMTARDPEDRCGGGAERMNVASDAVEAEAHPQPT